jgi:surface polysaccharide O-acyltransferase-like enzyme
MVSGALLLTVRAQAEGPGAFYRKRLLRLGPAFLFWQVFYILVARMWISGQQLSLGGVLALFADGSTYTHLYFLWLVVGLYAVAPVLYPFLAAGGRRRALATAGVLLFLTIAAYTAASVLTRLGQPRGITLTAFTQWLPYVGFFVAGAALNGLVLVRSRTIMVGAIGAVTLAAIILEYGLTQPGSTLRALLPLGYPTLLTTIVVLALFLTVQSLMARAEPSRRATGILRELSDAAFGVFLIHFVVMLVIRLVFTGAAGAQSTSFAGTALIWLAVVVISFALTIAARRVPFVRRIF